uniref:uncharacterized protein LOC100183630 n=1 Tax=Ciona intestinalis TaxID=7719 RepID=UPI000521770C
GGPEGAKVKIPIPCPSLAALKPIQLVGGEQTLFTVTGEGKVFATAIKPKLPPKTSSRQTKPEPPPPKPPHPRNDPVVETVTPPIPDEVLITALTDATDDAPENSESRQNFLDDIGVMFDDLVLEFDEILK